MAMTDLISFTLVDIAGRRAQCLVYVPTGKTVAELGALSDAIAAELDAITGAKIIASNVNLLLPLPGGLKASATAGHYVNLGANFGFMAANTEYRHTVRVPGILESKLVGDEVNTADGDVAAFVTAIEDGTAAVDPSDKFGNDLTTLLSAVATFRSA